MTLYKEPASIPLTSTNNGDAIETNGKNGDDISIENDEGIKSSVTELNTSTGRGGLEAEDDDDDNEIIGD